MTRSICIYLAVQFLYEMLMFRLHSPVSTATLIWKKCYLEAFSSAICLSISCVCDFSSSSFSLFCCSRLEIRALHFLLSFMFCSSTTSFWTIFHDKVYSLTIHWQVSNSLTFPGFQTSGHPNHYMPHCTLFQSNLFDRKIIKQSYVTRPRELSDWLIDDFEDCC